MDLDSRGPNLLRFLSNNSNGYNRRLTRSCIRTGTAWQKYQDLRVFENSTNKVNRYVSIGMDYQSVFEITCGFKSFARRVAWVVAVIAT
jgi:hypothetical protein